MIYLQTAPEGATYEKSLDLIGLIFKGGWVMIPLLLLSILTIVIVIERYLFLGKQGVGKKNNFESFLAALKVGNNTEAARLCEEDNAAWSRIFQYAALTEISGDEQEKLMDQAANVEVAYLERRLNVLSIVAGVAPLLGFIGTIAGVITIFFDMLFTNISGINGLAIRVEERYSKNLFHFKNSFTVVTEHAMERISKPTFGFI